jgi:phosphoribosylformylglycinamidine (FGAM) synthase PurS component
MVVIMKWKVEVGYKAEVFDAAGEGLKKDIADLGIQGVRGVRIYEL